MPRHELTAEDRQKGFRAAIATVQEWFEYHCYEGEDSCDAKLWHHTHQRVKVLRKLTNVGVEAGGMFRVRFSDGFEYDVFADELVGSPADFCRPSYSGNK